MTLRLAEAKALDIVLLQVEGKRRLIVSETNGWGRRGRHPMIDLRRLIRFALSLKGDLLMEILYRAELLRNNPGKKRAVLTAFLGEPELLVQGARMAALLARSLSGSRK